MAAKNRNTSPLPRENNLADELFEQYRALSALEVICKKAACDSPEIDAVICLIRPIVDSIGKVCDRLDAAMKAAQAKVS